MKSSVYIETTIPSYLTAWRSPELVMAANQEATRSWWDIARPRYDLFISDIVTQEASGGDPAKRRVTAIEGLPELDVSEEAEQLAARLLADAAIPERAKTDALHIAVATEPKKGTHTFYSVLSFGHAKNCPSGVFRRPAPHYPAR